jgi:hypothetical protein
MPDAWLPIEPRRVGGSCGSLLANISLRLRMYPCHRTESDIMPLVVKDEIVEMTTTPVMQ